jgi:aryl-alcohol dehydrogenase-like predicted oxidoreductase
MQTHPVAAVEIELSLFGLEPEALDVLKVCDELDIALVAYS